MFDMTSRTMHLLLPLMPQRIQSFCSKWLEILFSRFSLALEEGLVEIVYASINSFWGAVEGCEKKKIYIDFQLGPTLEQKLYYSCK